MSSPPRVAGSLTAPSRGSGPRAAQRSVALELEPQARVALLHSSLVRSDADLSTRLFAAPFFFLPGSLDKGAAVTQAICTPLPNPQTHLQMGAFVASPGVLSSGMRAAAGVQSPRPRVVSSFTGKGLSFCFLFLTLKRKLSALLQDTIAAKQNKPLPLNTKQNPTSRAPAFLGCDVSWRELRDSGGSW